jgi:uncharacterized protein YukE
MSDLLAPVQYEGVSGAAVLDAIPVAGNIAAAAEDFGNGNVVSGIVDVGSSALDVVGVIANPIATLASSCASFLMDYMSPLHEELELLTGSPEMVRALAETWDNLAGALREVAQEHADSVTTLQADWQGTAADSYAATAQGIEQMIATVGESCTGVAGGLRVAATIVEVVYEIVKGIIADLVGLLIQAVAEALATLGLGIPAIIGQCSAKIAQRVPQVAKWVEKIQDAMMAIDRVVSKLTQYGQLFEGRVTVIDTALGRAATSSFDVAAVDLVSVVQAANNAVKENW